MNNISNQNEYKNLLLNIGDILENGRKQSCRIVNNVLIMAYWEIGKSIVEFEQKGKVKAEYGTKLLEHLSRDLKFRYGKGFCRRNILDMRRFYLLYPIWRTVSAELSWSHYIQLISIENELARSFYEKQGEQPYPPFDWKLQFDCAVLVAYSLLKSS